MHVMVAAKHDASAYFLSSAAVKHHGFCHVADTVLGPTLGSLVGAPNVFESVAPWTAAGVMPWLGPFGENATLPLLCLRQVPFSKYMPVLIGGRMHRKVSVSERL